jgi:hypothetical protein
VSTTLADIIAESRRLLAEQGHLLACESALYDTANKPSTGKPAAESNANSALTAAKAQNATDQARLTGAFFEVPFRLAGLKPVVDGFVYEGMPAQIAKAFAEADQISAPAHRTRDPKTDTWHVTSGDSHFEIHELPSSREAAKTQVVDEQSKSPQKDASARDSDKQPSETATHEASVVKEQAAVTKRSSRNIPEYAITKSSLELEIEERPRMFKCEFIGRTVRGEDIRFGSAMIEVTDEGKPKGRPELTLVASHYVNGDEYALHIYDDVVMTPSGIPRGQGARTSATRYALDEFGRVYEKKFHRPLTSWGGILAWENLLHFQREYVALRGGGMARKQALEAAVKATSFGKHRVEAGFTELGVDATDDELIDLRDGRGQQLAPGRVEVVARKPLPPRE